MCIDLGINALIVESDAKVIVDLLNVVSLFATAGWAASYHAMAQWFWVGESGLA